MTDGSGMVKWGLALFGAGIVVPMFVGIPIVSSIGLLVALGGLTLTFFGATRRVQAQRMATFEDVVRAEHRTQLNRLRRLGQEIESFANSEAGKASVTVRVLATEAVQESQAIISQAAKMLAAQSDLKKLAAGRYEAEKAVQELEARLVNALPPEVESLNSALEARKAQIQQYATIDAKVQQVEASMGRAELALGEIKSRLALATAEETTVDEEGLRESIARVKALSQTFDEAEQMMEDMR